MNNDALSQQLKTEKASLILPQGNYQPNTSESIADALFDENNNRKHSYLETINGSDTELYKAPSMYQASEKKD